MDQNGLYHLATDASAATSAQQRLLQMLANGAATK
jgi:hypothetical protein